MAVATARAKSSDRTAYIPRAYVEASPFSALRCHKYHAMSKMDHETTATVIDEIHLAQGAKTCSQILSASSAELGPGLSHFCAIKLNSTVVLSDLGRFTAQCSFNTPGSSKERTAVSGGRVSRAGMCHVTQFLGDCDQGLVHFGLDSKNKGLLQPAGGQRQQSRHMLAGSAAAA